MRALVVLAATVVVLAAGCGSDEAPPRSALAERLAELCESTRVAVEDLGEPKDEGAPVFKPWSRIGFRFVDDVSELRGKTAGQRKQLASLVAYYKGFYDSLDLSFRLFEAGQATQIKQTLERGYAQLESGEAIAERLGAPECAVRPFEEA